MKDISILGAFVLAPSVCATNSRSLARVTGSAYFISKNFIALPAKNGTSYVSITFNNLLMFVTLSEMTIACASFGAITNPALVNSPLSVGMMA